MEWENELKTILSKKLSFSFTDWNCLLNFFSNYREKLSLEDVRKLCIRSEFYRTHYNKLPDVKDRISREDVQPNLYVYLEELEAKYYNKESLPTEMVAVAQ